MFVQTHRQAQPRRGNTLVLTSICMTGILGMTALAIDGTNEMAMRRQAQECCDAGALTACIKLASLNASSGTPTTTNLTAAANLSLSNNNYTSGTNCTVTVNWPPKSGSFQDTDSIEVYLNFTYSNLVTSGSS